MKSFPFSMDRNAKLKSLYKKIESLQSQIDTAAKFISEIEQGKLDVEYQEEVQEDDDQSQNPLSKSLVSLQTQMVKVSTEEEQRKWASETLSHFMDILRNRNNNMKELADDIIKHLIKCLNANQGGIFYINDDHANDVHIELLACYAYERKKYLTRRIEIGEGLVGQVILEKEYIYLTEIPQNYISITSGLGKATPTHLLIFPLKNEEKVYGAIEIASFHAFKDYEIAFILQLCESIASTFSNVKNSVRTQKLLEETQQQAEEMRSQGEELQQNMEELQATQEEIERKASEIESRMLAIDESGIASIEFELDGTIVNANSNFLKLMGYGLEEIHGKHHRIFISAEYASSEDYVQFWKELAEGKAQYGEYERYDKNGKKVFIQGSYSILRDSSGEPKRVIKLAADITSTKQAQSELQEQAEIMKAQDEELRQNLEELSTTQEEIERRAREIENRITAIDESGIASIEFELDGTIVNANTNFLKLMGYALHEIQGKHHRIFVTEEYAKSDEYYQFWKDLSEGKARFGEYERIGKSGNQIFIQGSYSILRDNAGAPKRIIKLAADITAMIHTQAELQQQSEEIKAQDEELRQNLEELAATQEEIERRASEIESKMVAIDESGIASIEFKLDGTIINANNNFLKLMGYTLEEIQGVHHRIFVTEEYAKSDDYYQFWKDLSEGKARYGEYERIGKNGNQIFIQGSYSILRDSGGHPKSIIKLAADITSTKQAQEELQLQAEEMKAQDEELRQNLEELAAIQEEMERVMNQAQDREELSEGILNAVPDTIFAIDPNYELLSFNDVFKNVWEAEKKVVRKGVNLQAFYSKTEWKNEHEVLFMKALAGEEFSIITSKRIGSKKMPFKVYYTPIKDNREKVVSVVVIAQDYTEVEQLRLENERLKEEMKNLKLK